MLELAEQQAKVESSACRTAARGCDLHIVSAQQLLEDRCELLFDLFGACVDAKLDLKVNPDPVIVQEVHPCGRPLADADLSQRISEVHRKGFR